MMVRPTLAGIALAPVFAVAIAAAAQAQPASTGGGGSMAFPDPVKSGEVQVPGSTTRDTGSMAFPASPGGLRNSGAPPAGKKAAPGKTAAAAPATPASASAAASSTAPTPQGMAAARALATAPGAEAVPYVDFSAPAKPAITHHAKAVTKKPSA